MGTGENIDGEDAAQEFGPTEPAVSGWVRERAAGESVELEHAVALGSVERWSDSVGVRGPGTILSRHCAAGASTPW